MAGILARSQKIQLSNKDLRKELSAWIRPNSSEAGDGLPGYSFGYSDFESFLGSFIFGTFDMSSSRARVETANIKSSPAVAVLSTDRDDKLTWMKAGVLFETLFLAATRMDIRFDLFSQPSAVPRAQGGDGAGAGSEVSSSAYTHGVCGGFKAYAKEAC